MNIFRYAKAIVAAVSAGLLAVQTVITMSNNAHAWVTVTIAVLTTLSVYLVPNAPAPNSLITSPAPSEASIRGMMPG
jgi:hypothetical protein